MCYEETSRLTSSLGFFAAFPLVSSPLCPLEDLLVVVVLGLVEERTVSASSDDTLSAAPFDYRLLARVRSQLRSEGGSELIRTETNPCQKNFDGAYSHLHGPGRVLVVSSSGCARWRHRVSGVRARVGGEAVPVRHGRRLRLPLRVVGRSGVSLVVVGSLVQTDPPQHGGRVRPVHGGGGLVVTRTRGATERFGTRLRKEMNM